LLPLLLGLLCGWWAWARSGRDLDVDLPGSGLIGAGVGAAGAALAGAKKLGEAAVDTVSDAAGAVVDGAKDVTAKVADGAAGAAGAVAGAAGAALDTAKDVAGSAVDVAKDAGAAVAGGVAAAGAKAADVAGSAVDVAKDAGAAVAGGVAAAGAKAADVAGSAVDAAKGAGAAVAGGVAATAGAAAAAVSSVGDKAADAAGAAVDTSKAGVAAGATALGLTSIGVAAAKGDPDDLLLIKGVGPKLNGVLNGLGITRFDQIAAWTAGDVDKVDDHLGEFKDRIGREEWIPQAKLLAAGNMAEWERLYGKATAAAAGAVAMLAIGIPGAVGDADDLLKIKGIGPKLNTLLTGLGITRFDQIAAWGAAEIDKVDDHLGSFKNRITRDSWIEQAGLLARGAIAEFEAKFGKLDSENK
jgi:predicted flap endonuclease-1-like 5' DNA nuclease